jgi:hypothetical protein
METQVCRHGVAELRRLREVEEENRRLKQLVADLTLDKQMLQEACEKLLKPAQKRAVVQFFRVGYQVSERRACRGWECSAPAAAIGATHGTRLPCTSDCGSWQPCESGTAIGGSMCCWPGRLAGEPQARLPALS